MTVKHIPPLFISFFLVLCTLSVTTEAASLPDTWPHESSDLDADPDVTYGILPNGLRFAVMANSTPADQASIRLLFDVGSKHEYDDERGIAHFIEHMAFNGSKNVPEGEMVKMLERHGLAFGADANAFTSYDRTVYQLDLPNMKPDTVGTAFLLMRETASNVSFNADAIERERGVVLAEKRRDNVHARRSADASLAFTYPGTRMLERHPIGTEEGISTVTREQMVSFYNQFYRPENAFLVVVGDFDQAEMTRKISSSFGDWEAVGDVRELTYSEDDAQISTPEATAKHFKNEQDRTSISVIVSSAFKHKPDNRQTRIDGLFEFAGHNILSKRLHNKQLDGGVSYLGAGAQISSFNEIAVSAYLGLFLDEENWEAGLADGVTELTRALQHGFSKAEVDELLANLKTNFEYGVSSADKRRSGALASGILNAFKNDAVFVTPQTSLDIFNEFAATVKSEAISREFRRHWEASAPRLFFVSKGDIEGAEENALQIYHEQMQAVREKPEDQQNKSFAYTDFGGIGTVASKQQQSDVDATLVRFSNNVMLNLKKTDLQKDTVQMLLRFGGGTLASPKSEPGLLSLVGGTFTNGGLEAHSASELRQILAGRTANAALGVGIDSFSFRSAVTKKDLLIQLQLWAAYMTAPAFRPEPIKHFQQSVEALYHSLDNTPRHVAHYRVGELLYSGDPRFFLAPKESIQRLGKEDLQGFMQQMLNESVIEITIVGDIDIDATIEAVAATFGALPPRDATPRPYTEERKVNFPGPGTEILRHKGSIDQAILQVYWPTVDYSDVARSARLDLLSTVLSNRIRDAVREKMGASYAPSVSNLEHDIFPDYGYFAMTVDTKPDDIATIRTIMDDEISTLVSSGISEDEIERAKTPLLEGIDNAKKSNGHWIGRLSRSQSDPATLTYLPIVQDTWQTVTAAELIELAQTYLSPERALEIHIVPGLSTYKEIDPE